MDYLILIFKVRPDLYESIATKLVILNTDKANQVLMKIKNKSIKCCKYDIRNFHTKELIFMEVFLFTIRIFERLFSVVTASASIEKIKILHNSKKYYCKSKKRVLI
ncbi:hypothetical protein ACQKP0_18895 [Heyndrickxia sp. NPDC080065]|uniref:hypothetical protein n=1 Tax=Heyndrickxia sp. NPDC080065 TaxID=3390568 RepID=UPI003D0310E1